MGRRDGEGEGGGGGAEMRGGVDNKGIHIGTLLFPYVIIMFLSNRQQAKIQMLL